MDIDFKSYKDSVSDALQHSRLERALTGLDNMVAAIQAPARYRDAIENLRANYRLLKQYALDGAEDPQRAAMTARMKEDARRLSAELERHYLMQQSPAVYYSTLRFEQKQPESGIAGLIDSLRQMKEMQGRRMLSGEPSVQSADEEALRQLQRRLFDRVWVTFPLSNADTDALNRLLSDTTTSRTLKLHLTAALLLGALNTFDHARVETLARLYMHHNADAAISTAALCAIVLIGHLNKAVGANSAYRGLGSMDFHAAARSTTGLGRAGADGTHADSTHRRYRPRDRQGEQRDHTRHDEPQGGDRRYVRQDEPGGAGK